MNNPSLYTTVNDLQKRDAQDVLEMVKNNLPWGKNEIVLDVGCGPGDLTTTLLKSYLPSDCEIVGCDISEAMVKYAQSKYGNDQFTFKQLDIGNSNIWMNWEEETYDKIFSFYCLHWVKDQRQAALNMHALLKKGGHLITMFATSHPFFLLFQALSKQPKWKTYTKIWDTWEVFYNNGDPQEEYVRVLKSCSFKIINCTTHRKSFVHNSLDEFIDYFESINPFKKRIPADKTKEFLNDCCKIMLEEGMIKRRENGVVIHEYTVIVAHAAKIDE